MAQYTRLKYKNLVVSQHFLLVISYALFNFPRAGNMGETRPDFPFETTLQQDFLPLPRRLHGDRLVAHPFHSIHQKRDMTDMVKTRMTNEDMIYSGEFLEAGIAHPCVCVNQNIIIQEHRGSAQVPAGSTAACEYSEFHVSYISFPHNARLHSADFSPAESTNPL